MFKFVCFILLGCSFILVNGCASKAAYIDAGGTDTIVSLNKINIQDWDNSANKLVDSLLTSGVIERAKRQPAVLGISRISNRTTQHVDTDNLIKKIRIALNRTGKIETTTTIGATSEDPLAQQTAEYNAMMGITESDPTSNTPDFSLSGKLLEDRARDGSIRQITYTFQMTLTDVKTGRAVWEDEVLITKAGKKSSIGW